MKFEEPKVEFVAIEMDDVVITSVPTCNPDPAPGSGVESCTGPTSPSNNCTAYGVFMVDD